ncbi:MAG TPA: site-2 protease family protein [Puia sp.]|uniref:site-2 protease family protein n=1 Tax=Puia sp. TaxID=2045100 RepID=UPI002CFCE2F8|nr:site-2 protease family protein [Puia sp.]HVU94126.1 site-2 protease family protein [Puia sp.]
MKGSIKILSVRGIRISVHWTFLLLLGWVVLLNVEQGTNAGRLLWSLLFVLAVFACVALHELGHAMAAGYFGIRARDIVLLPIGGTASIEKFPDNPRQELSISLAGPAMNIIIAFLLWLLQDPGAPFWAQPERAPAFGLGMFVFDLRMVNVGLAVFNLIPAFPMDGGRILRALLGFRMNYVRATTIAAAIGKGIAWVFIALGIVVINPILPLVGVFILFSAGTEEHYLRLRSLVKGIRLNEVVMNDYASLQADMEVREAASILMTNHSKYFMLMEGARPVGSINRLEVVKALAEKRYGEKLHSLVKGEVSLLDGAATADTVLEQLGRDDEQLYPVVEGGQFEGVVSLNHIVEYLLLHRAGEEDYGRVRSLAGLLH